MYLAPLLPSILSGVDRCCFLDFVRVMPGVPKAGVQSRIIVAPEHAKRLLRALEDNIAKYERVFGSIRISDESLISPLASVKGEA